MTPPLAASRVGADLVVRRLGCCGCGHSPTSPAWAWALLCHYPNIVTVSGGPERIRIAQEIPGLVAELLGGEAS